MIEALVPTIVILQSDDVVFPEIISGLDLNKNQRRRAGIRYSVYGASRDLHGLSGLEYTLAFSHRNARNAAHDCPLLGTMRVLLETQTLTRFDGDFLDFVIAAFAQIFVMTPRPVVFTLTKDLAVNIEVSASHLLAGEPLHDIFPARVPVERINPVHRAHRTFDIINDKSGRTVANDLRH
jgi:hypothetical protein